MMVMPSNQSGTRVGYLAGRYPGQLGHLFSPGFQRGPWQFLPYALDNGAFGCWKNRTEWPEQPWLELLLWAQKAKQDPLWVLIPDAVQNREWTLARWRMHSPTAKECGWPLAFAVQDGMTPADVPPDAAVVFIGGGDEFKWGTLEMWCREFPRVHVGRVNGYAGLEKCLRAGAESCDGTGWFRGDESQSQGLERFLCEQATSSKYADSAAGTGPGSAYSGTSAPARAGARK